MSRILIQNSLFMTFMDDGYTALQINNKDLLIEDGIITRVAYHIPPEGCEVIDGRGKLTIPGFVNARSRALAAKVSKGIAEDINCDSYGNSPLYHRVNPFINLALEHLSDEEIEALLALSLYEAIESGTTTLIDQGTGRDAAIFLRLCERAGLRAVAAPMMMSRLALPEGDKSGAIDYDAPGAADEQAQLSANRQLIEAYPAGRVRAAVGVGGADITSDALLRQAAALARETGALLLCMLCAVMVTAQAEDPIKIGYLAWASGPDAYFGMVAIAALEDYIEEINEKGGLLGRPVELVWYDISKDFSESVNATNKLINMDNVTAIIGPDGSPFAITLGDIVAEAQVPLLPNCGAVNVTVNEDGTVKPYVFRVAPVSTLQYQTLAQYAYDVLGARRVACISESTNISSVEAVQFFNEHFTMLGGEIVAQESYMVNDTEFRAQITNVMQAAPEWIFMPAAAYKEVCPFAIQLCDMGYGDQVKILGSDAWYNIDALQVAGKELEGAIVISALDMNDPALDPIHAKFNEKHGDLNMSLHLYALYAVNAMQFVEWAINETGSTEGPVLRDALENCEGVAMTTGGSWYFDEQHNPVGPEFTILSVQDSQQVTLGSYAIGK